MFTLWEIARWTVHAGWQYIIYYSLLPDWLWLPEPETAPPIWLAVRSQFQWEFLRSSPQYRGTFAGYMIEAASAAFSEWFDHAIDTARDAAHRRYWARCWRESHCADLYSVPIVFAALSGNM